MGKIEYQVNHFTLTSKSKVNRCLKANALKGRAKSHKHRINKGLWRLTEEL